MIRTGVFATKIVRNDAKKRTERTRKLNGISVEDTVPKFLTSVCVSYSVLSVFFNHLVIFSLLALVNFFVI